MGLFDPPAEAKYPRRWRDMSFEYRGMFAYHIAMMVMFVAGILPVLYEVAVAAGIFVVIAGVSWDRRRRMDWHHPPLVPLDILKTLGVLATTGLFAFVASQGFPFTNPHFAPWFLGLTGIGVFGILQQLKVVTFSEAEFVELGKPKPAPAVEVMNPETGEPFWHRSVRALHRVVFFAVWLTFMAFFYFDTSAIRDGSPRPTPTATSPITDHGIVMYVTADRAALIGLLQIISMIGIPTVILSGFALQFLVGVKLFPGATSLFGKRPDGDAG
jgi:hypothetical protein